MKLSQIGLIGIDGICNDPEIDEVCKDTEECPDLEAAVRSGIRVTLVDLCPRTQSRQKESQKIQGVEEEWHPKLEFGRDATLVLLERHFNVFRAEFVTLNLAPVARQFPDRCLADGKCRGPEEIEGARGSTLHNHTIDIDGTERGDEDEGDGNELPVEFPAFAVRIDAVSCCVCTLAMPGEREDAEGDHEDEGAGKDDPSDTVRGNRLKEVNYALSVMSRMTNIDGIGAAGTVEDCAVGKNLRVVGLSEHVALRRVRDCAVEIARAVRIEIRVIVVTKDGNLTRVDERHDNQGLTILLASRWCVGSTKRVKLC